MSEASKPEPHPFERFREAMKQLLTVSKEDVLKLEAEEKKRKAKRERSTS